MYKILLPAEGETAASVRDYANQHPRQHGLDRLKKEQFLSSRNEVSIVAQTSWDHRSVETVSRLHHDTCDRRLVRVRFPDRAAECFRLINDGSGQRHWNGSWRDGSASDQKRAAYRVPSLQCRGIDPTATAQRVQTRRRLAIYLRTPAFSAVFRYFVPPEKTCDRFGLRPHELS
jgi:hypothetical protein